MKLNNNKKSVKISRSLFMLYAVMVCGIVFALPAFAADDQLVVVENLSTFIFSLIRAVWSSRGNEVENFLGERNHQPTGQR